MKVLLKKLKNSNKVALTFYILTTIAYLVNFIFFAFGLINLKGIETFLRILVLSLFGIYFFVYFIWNLINIVLKRNKTFIITTVISIIFIIIFCIATFVFNFLYDKIDNFSEKNTIVYTTYLIALKDTKITDDSNIGMINNSDDIEWNILPKELIKEKNIKSKIIDYDDYYIMLSDLYNKKVDGIFVSANYLTLFSGEENYENIANDTFVVYKYSKEMENKDLDLSSNKTLTEPFTVLIMGVDSTTDGLNANAAFNGDTLMLVTFNPNTLTATIFSIPRDTYVPIACNHNRYAKINASAAYGTSCVIDTIEQLTDIDVDYYAKINFKGVVDLVEALKGIDVEVTKSFCEQNSDRSFAKEDLICLEKGFQHLNGEETLAYARHRKTLTRSDIDRTKNQQLIVEAMAKKLIKISSFSDFENILNAVSNNIATNMKKDQILSSYNILKKMLSKSLNDEDFIKIKKTYLEYYSLPVYYSNMYISAIGHYEGSLDAIKKAMRVNLELEEEEPIKTFSYSYNEDYESKIIGKGITTGTKLETVPSFIGQSVSYVRDWAIPKNISIKTDGNDSGIVKSQSVHEGVLVTSISSITLTTESNYSPITPKDESKEDTSTETIDPLIEDLIS